MPTSNIKWFIRCRKTHAPDTFKNVLIELFKLFPESQAKLLANSYIGELGRKYSCKDHGFTCNLLDTAQCIWTSALAENRDVVIDSYQNPNSKQELFLVRERHIQRIFSDNTSINRSVISQGILKCLNMMCKNWSHAGNGNSIRKIYAINTDGIFVTNPRKQHPNKKDAKFDISHIGKTFQTDSPATCFEKQYRENFNPDNYTDYVGNGAIYYGVAGCCKTYRLCKMASEAENPIILSFTNKAIENIKEQFRKRYQHTGLENECNTFDRYFCDYHGRDISNLQDKNIFIDEYSMTLNKWMTKLYQAFAKYHLTIYKFGDTNQCDPVEAASRIHYDYFQSVPVSEMCPKRVEMKYIPGAVCYDIQTRDLLAKVLKSGTVEHKFEPRIPSYYNICYLNSTRKKITEKCCDMFVENRNYHEVDFKYQRVLECYDVCTGMPLLVTKS